eukprot:GHVP01028482.1.p1 GENE.GHVP01028482.1~~GHVP01028482.1.p1  ORF type:complete len:272 (+),score=33.62 GHVP01028482.1:122-817(+)
MNIRTTDSERTKASAICLLEGIYGSSERYRTYHKPINRDSFLGTSIRGSHEIKQDVSKHLSDEFFKSIKTKYKQRIDFPFQMRDIYRASMCNTNKKSRLDSIFGHITKDVEKYNLDLEHILSKNIEYRDKIVYPLLKDILSELKNNTKFSLFSAHDTSLFILLIGLDSDILEWPGYNSNIIFETWEKEDGAILVRMIFNGKVKSIDGLNTDEDGMFKLKVFSEYIENMKIR